MYNCVSANYLVTISREEHHKCHMLENLQGLFRKQESLIAIDIGATSVKLLELDISGDKPRLLNIGMSPLAGEIFTNNVIAKPEKVAEQVTALLEANSISDKRTVVAMPAPAVFTKKIKTQKLPPDELGDNIQYEAANIIPHSIDAVRLDYHVIGNAGKNQLEVLVVAVKTEIIDSYMSCLGLAGLETAVVDIDHFALQNMFEMAVPNIGAKTTALINMGARYSAINICKEGNSLFTGDIPVGGRVFTDALMTELGVPVDVAESLKRPNSDRGNHAAATQEILDKNVEYVASEFNRQLSFFWNASGAEEGIDQIYICGGGTLVPGIGREIAEKTGIECVSLDPLTAIDCGSNFDAQYLKDLSPFMGICVGMGTRQPGDKMSWDQD